MKVDDLTVMCTDDLWYDDLLVGKKGSEYNVLSYVKQSVIIRGEQDIDAIVSSDVFRKHFLIDMKGGGNNNGDFSNE